MVRAVQRRSEKATAVHVASTLDATKHGKNECFHHVTLEGHEGHHIRANEFGVWTGSGA